MEKIHQAPYSKNLIQFGIIKFDDLDIEQIHQKYIFLFSIYDLFYYIFYIQLFYKSI